MIDFLRYAGIVLGVGFLPGVWLGTLFADELKVLWRKVFPRDTGRHVTAHPVTARHDATREPRTTLLGPAETTAHADAMREAAGPFLPALPEDTWPPYVTPQEWQSYVNAGRAVEPVRTGEHPPWTGSQPALDEAAEAEWMRREYVRSHLRDAAEVTPELMREVLAGLRALPAGGVSFDCGNGLHAPVCDGRGCSCSCHGKAAPVADVLEGERLTAVMQQ